MVDMIVQNIIPAVKEAEVGGSGCHTFECMCV